MPSSILKDAHHLSPAGRTLCTLSFMAGLLGLMLWVKITGGEIEAIRARVLEERAQAITASKPDELASILPPIKKPTSQSELSQRQGILDDMLTRLAQDASESPLQKYKDLAEKADPIELIKFGVREGTIHPLEAPYFIDEIHILKKTAPEPTQTSAPTPTPTPTPTPAQPTP